MSSVAHYISYDKVYRKLSNIVHSKKSQNLPWYLVVYVNVPLFIIVVFLLMVYWVAASSWVDVPPTVAENPEVAEEKRRVIDCYEEQGILNIDGELSFWEALNGIKTITECWGTTQINEMINTFMHILVWWIIFNLILTLFPKVGNKSILRRIKQREIDHLTEHILLRVTSQKGLNYRQVGNLQSYAKDIQGSAAWRGVIVTAFILSILKNLVPSSNFIAPLSLGIARTILNTETGTVHGIFVTFIVLIILSGFILRIVYWLANHVFEYISGERINRTILHACTQSVSVLQSIEVQNIENITNPAEYRCKISKILSLEFLYARLIWEACDKRQKFLGKQQFQTWVSVE